MQVLCASLKTHGPERGALSTGVRGDWVPLHGPEREGPLCEPADSRGSFGRGLSTAPLYIDRALTGEIDRPSKRPSKRPSRRVLGDGPLDGGPLFEPDQGPFDGARFASKVPSPLQRPCDRKGPNQSTGPLRLLLGRPSGSASTEGPSASTEGRLFEPADDPNDGLSDGAGLDDTVPDPIRSTGASTPPGVYRINRVPRRVYGPSPKAVEAVLDGPGDCEAEDGLLDGPSDRLLTGAGPDAGPRAGPRAAPDTVSRGADGPFLAGPSWRALCAVGSGPFRGPSAPFL
mmetsp:Transcript_9044/g.31826  ORF Transcript_9044/g.31826 Transcript_9044/m.31826 type:complete len:287 (-) Transcript_9044:308-1168(-)